MFRLPDEGSAIRAIGAAQPRQDVLGNAIDEAVGEYRVDSTGDMYERHAPETALLKLGPAGV